MRKGRASETAKGVAASRAMEAELPEAARILSDTVARKLLGRRWTVIGRSLLPHRIALSIHRHFVPGLHDYLVARARYIDDLVRDRLGEAIAQLVILGAGFDTRPYRLDGLRDRVGVFEVDHPASQREKLDALAGAFGAVPGHVAFVPVDFQTQTLAQGLRQSGYREEAPTLFIMEGVTMYLSPAAVDETLAFIRSHSGPGSSVVFDYTYPEVLTGAFPHKAAQGLKKMSARTGEPFTFAIPNGRVEPFLGDRGFAQVRDIDHDGLDCAYFAGQPHRRTCPIFSIAHAAVAR